MTYELNTGAYEMHLWRYIHTQRERDHSFKSLGLEYVKEQWPFKVCQCHCKFREWVPIKWKFCHWRKKKKKKKEILKYYLINPLSMPWWLSQSNWVWKKWIWGGELNNLYYLYLIYSNKKIERKYKGKKKSVWCGGWDGKIGGLKN